MRAGHAGWLAVLALAAAGPASAAETVEFTFNPPVGSVVTEKQVVTRTVKQGEKSRTEVRRSTAEISYARREGGGFTATARVVGAELERDGQRVKDPATEVMKGLVVEYELDASGSARGVKGLDVLVQRLLDAAPPGQHDMMKRVLNPAALARKEASEYNARTGALGGSKLKVGEGKDFEDEFVLPDGAGSKLKGTVKLAGRAKCEKARCVKLEVTSGADPSAALAAVGAPAAANAGGGVRPVMKSTGERIVDPATLMPRSEKITRTITMTLQGPTGPLQSEIVETREYTYSY